MVLMDIKGACNAVKPTALTRALQQVNLPTRFIMWALDFMTNRIYTPRRSSTQGKPITISSCLPQGSPVSPILFAILMSEIERKFPPDVKVYADDIQILQHHDKGTFSHLQETCEQAVALIKTKQLDIEPKKTELLVCKGRRTKTQGPDNELSLQIEGITIKEQSHIKYLGIIFDQNLTFEKHITSRLATTIDLATKLRRPTKRAGHINPVGVRNIVSTTMLPTILYGAEAWYEHTTALADPPEWSTIKWFAIT